MTNKTAITVAHGDGIGPEIMDAALHIMQESGATLDIETVEIGEKVYLKGHKSGIEEKTWESLRRTKTFFKAPITTPQGGGFKSLNVTIRTALGLYANIRPCISYHPYVKTKHPDMDVVIIRENEEDLYVGLEYSQTEDVCQALKIISREGSEKIIRYAFEYAKHHNRKKVSCFTKDNILKLSDGLFRKVYEEIAKEYPTIETEHWIIDIGTAKLADTPENFDVIVLANLYGDVLSDVSAQIAGSVGLAGSANIGISGAMFEAIHGSAPRRAGQNMANPSGLILAGIMLLNHIGQPQAAERMHNAWLCTLEEGIHTYDIFDENTSHKKVGTKEFAKEVVKRLGKQPIRLNSIHYENTQMKVIPCKPKKYKTKKELVGVDVFIQSQDSVEAIHQKLETVSAGLTLKMIGNRGIKMWPNPLPESFCIDQWRCRFMDAEKNSSIKHSQIASLLNSFSENNIDFIKIENLYTYDGKAAYTLSQDEQ